MPPSSFNGTGFYTTSQLRTELEALGIQAQQDNGFSYGTITTLLVESVGYSECLLDNQQNSIAYEVIRTLRKCIYGKVKHAVLLEYDINRQVWIRNIESQVALKIMNKEIIQSNTLLENPLNEIALQSSLMPHSNVLSVINTLQDDVNIYSILPFCANGELFAQVALSGAFEEETAACYFRQIISGLQSLQSQGVCHRDLSLENVLVCHLNIAKIIDFGVATKVGRYLNSNDSVGKVNYMAPEVYKGHMGMYDGFAADIWSAGVMLFTMVAGAPPFERPDMADARFVLVRQGQLSQMLDSWGMTHISHDVRDLLTRILVVDNPDARLDVEGILNHGWMNRL